MINLIELGAGEYVINHSYFGECAAVFIEPAPLPGEVGADASKSGLRRDTCAGGGTVITFYNLASAAVFAEQLDCARRRIGERRGCAPKPSDVLTEILTTPKVART